jgi:hypothetical protein
VRKLDLAGTVGVHRIAWNLRGEAAASQAQSGQRGGIAGGGGRGGPPQGPVVPAGRYRATLGTQTGDIVTPFGDAQVFQVVSLPR